MHLPSATDQLIDAPTRHDAATSAVRPDAAPSGRPPVHARGTVMTTASRPSRPWTHTPDACVRAGHRTAHPSELAGFTRSVAAPEGLVNITLNANADSSTRSTSMSPTARPRYDAIPVCTTAAAHPPITGSASALPLD
jgi:hypothetical protein